MLGFAPYIFVGRIDAMEIGVALRCAASMRRRVASVGGENLFLVSWCHGPAWDSCRRLDSGTPLGSEPRVALDLPRIVPMFVFVCNCFGVRTA